MSAPSPARSWTRVAARYGTSDARRSMLQLLNTAIPFAALWTAMALSVHEAYWLTLLLSVPAAAFLVRLFMIQHDCGHRSFFRARWLNDAVGSAIGVVTLTPHGYWRKAHNIHHATSGNLNKRGTGDVYMLTVREYLALTPWKRFLYRAYRHPAIFLGIGPLYLFVMKFRLPLDLIRHQRGMLRGIMLTNLAIAIMMTGLALWLGTLEAFMLQVPIVVLSSTAGVWLFYVQHQFADTYWQSSDDWSFHEAAIHGSSYYDLPQPLRWLTADIGIHHIHHLSSRIPNYRLRECLDDHAELRGVGRLTLLGSLSCLRLALWDEDTQRLVPFSALAHKPA